MALSNDLISQFVKITNDNEKIKKESTAYGTIIKQGNTEYVKLDGSDLLTPITSTTVVNDGDRVMVSIKNHTAIVTGDFTNPSANNKHVTEIGNKITEVEILVADKVTTQDLQAINAYIENIKAVSGKYEELTAITAEIETLQAKYANMEHITAKDAEIINAEIESLKVKLGEFTSVSTEDLEAVNADLDNLIAYNASFTYVSAEVLEAIKADIKELNVNKLDAESAKITFATIDFSNIGEAAIQKLFSDSGIIKDLIMSDGKVTGELVGVTIKGDLIEGNTIKADKLVIRGVDGIYYKLNIDALGETTVSSDGKYQNGIDGSILIAKSITAEKVAVDDLVAFGATIGGFNITSNSLYSGVKESIENTTRGVFMSNDGQINIGDANNYLKYYKTISSTDNTIDVVSDITIEANSASELNVSIPAGTYKINISDYSESSFEISFINNNISIQSETYVNDSLITLDMEETLVSIQNNSDTALNISNILLTTMLIEYKLDIQAGNITFGVNGSTIEQMIQDVDDKVSNAEQKLDNFIASNGSNNEVDKVVTSTGYKFDSDGLTISKTGSEMSTNIDEDGMVIKRDKEERLIANNEGVIAYDLHAKTYLIIGTNSRFEDYEKDGEPQTGCFWITNTEVE